MNNNPSLVKIDPLYKVKGVKDSALEYYNRCLSISEEIGNKVGIAAVFFNMGHIYLSGELDTALMYYKKSLELSEYIENSIRCKIHWTDCQNQMVTVQITRTSDRLIYPCWNTMWIA